MNQQNNQGGQLQQQQVVVPQIPQSGPMRIDKRFLSSFSAGTYCCCCVSWTLASGMSFLTILGMVIGVLYVLGGIILAAFGLWFGILFIVIGVIGVYFNYVGNQGVNNFDVEKFRTYYYYCIFSTVASTLSNVLNSLPQGLASVITSLFLSLCISLYILWMVWSFYVRLEAGDLNTLKFGPHYIPPQQNTGTIVQGQIVQGQMMNQGGYVQGGGAQGGQIPIDNANIGGTQKNNAGYEQEMVKPGNHNRI